MQLKIIYACSSSLSLMCATFSAIESQNFAIHYVVMGKKLYIGGAEFANHYSESNMISCALISAEP